MEVPWSRDGACKRNLHRKAQRCTAVSADCIDRWISSEVFTIHCALCNMCGVWCVVVYCKRCNGAADAGLSRQGAEIGIVKGGRIIAAQITPIIN